MFDTQNLFLQQSSRRLFRQVIDTKIKYVSSIKSMLLVFQELIRDFFMFWTKFSTVKSKLFRHYNRKLLDNRIKKIQKSNQSFSTIESGLFRLQLEHNFLLQSKQKFLNSRIGPFFTNQISALLYIIKF